MSYLVPRGNKHSKRHGVYAVFVGISFLLHILALSLLFFVYQYDTVVSHITLHKDMPLVKFMPTPAKLPKSSHQATTVAMAKSVAPSPEKKIINQSSPQAVETVKEEKTKGTRAALLTESAKKEKSKKQAVQKNKKKEARNNKADVKSKQVVKEKIKEEKPAKELVVEKKVEQKQLEQTQVPLTVVEPEKNQLVGQNDQMAVVGPTIEQDLEFTIGETIDDPKLLQYYAQLQTAVSDAWKPPVGIADECVCDVLIALDAQGKIKDVKVVKSSGVLIYDIAARNALQEAKLPKWTFGRTITISFKQ